MPAKVFAIGLHRTGTTSLARALSILGLRTRDFPWRLFDNVEDPILNEFDAFTDNPMPLVYPYLDGMFPGSKFILTTRQEEEWLRSVEWLFRKGRIRFDLERNGLADSIHFALYGATAFDRRRCAQTYSAYHAEVAEYFRDRPQDLLRIDLSLGNPWEALAAFLDAEIPAAPFPESNSRHQEIQLAHYIQHYRSLLRRPRNRLTTSIADQRLRPLDSRVPLRPWMHLPEVPKG